MWLETGADLKWRQNSPYCFRYVSHIWEDYSGLGPVHCVRSSGGLGLASDELGRVSITLQGTGNMLFFRALLQQGGTYVVCSGEQGPHYCSFVSEWVMGLEVQIFISVGRFPIDRGGQVSIRMVGNLSVQERELSL